jgi:hypothetical protein
VSKVILGNMRRKIFGKVSNNPYLTAHEYTKKMFNLKCCLKIIYSLIKEQQGFKKKLQVKNYVLEKESLS